MAYKAAAFLITFVLNLISGVVIFLVMLLAMNGYHESDAQWGLLTYTVLAVVTAVLTSIGAVVLTSSLLKRRFSAAVSALIAVLVFGITGAILEIVYGLIGVGVAEYVRVNY